MDQDLTDILQQNGIEFEHIAKSEKVRLLSRWNSVFEPLIESARKGHRSSKVCIDNAAEVRIQTQPICAYFILPDDDSSKLSVYCRARAVPELTALLSDTYTKCDEIVVVDAEFSWSYVLVNHGASGVGKYFMLAGSGIE